MRALRGADGNGHLFWECTYPPFVEIRENLQFHDLINWIKDNSLGVCFGMGGYHCFLVSTGALLLLRMLLRVLVICWNWLLDLTLLVCS